MPLILLAANFVQTVGLIIFGVGLLTQALAPKTGNTRAVLGLVIALIGFAVPALATIKAEHSAACAGSMACQVTNSLGN